MEINQENYVDLAQKFIDKMRVDKEKNPRKRLVTTTKLRGLLSMLSDIYNTLRDRPDENLDPQICSRIDYLRVRFVYECGKESTVKDFVNDTKLLEVLGQIQRKRSGFLLFYHYMEALVAYFKFYGLDEKEGAR